MMFLYSAKNCSSVKENDKNDFLLEEKINTTLPMSYECIKTTHSANVAQCLN